MLLDRRAGPCAVAHSAGDNRLSGSASGEDGLGVLTLIPRMPNRDARVAARTGGICNSTAGNPISVRVGIEPRSGDGSGSVTGDEYVTNAALCRSESAYRIADAPMKALPGGASALDTGCKGLGARASARLDNPRAASAVRIPGADEAAVAAARAACDYFITLRALRQCGFALWAPGREPLKVFSPECL